jgi:hypothetical protein
VLPDVESEHGHALVVLEQREREVLHLGHSLA